MKRKLVELLNIIFGFRKFLAWLALFLVAIMFRVGGQIDGGQFVDLMKATFMGFVAANGFEHFTSLGKQYMTSRWGSAPVADVIEPVGQPQDGAPVQEREGDEP